MYLACYRVVFVCKHRPFGILVEGGGIQKEKKRVTLQYFCYVLSNRLFTANVRRKETESNLGSIRNRAV